jgi:hypothetical protein
MPTDQLNSASPHPMTGSRIANSVIGILALLGLFQAWSCGRGHGILESEVEAVSWCTREQRLGVHSDLDWDRMRDCLERRGYWIVYPRD